MQFSITGKGALRFFGWVLISFFWLCVLIAILNVAQSPADSGAGMVVFGMFYMLISYPLLLVVPFLILVYGVRKEHDRPLLRVLFKWCSVASIALTFSVIVVMTNIL